MPYFNRAQMGVILFLGAVLLLLWGWRENFGRPPAPPPALSFAPVFVEAAGAVDNPGVFEFTARPSLPQVWRLARGPEPVPDKEEKLPSGCRLEISADGSYQVGLMAGAKLLTLGLALDLNKATALDLDALPGIGPALAKRIIDYRQRYGPFKKIDDLEQVSGIGPKKLALIKPYVFIEEKGTD